MFVEWLRVMSTANGGDGDDHDKEYQAISLMFPIVIAMHIPATHQLKLLEAVSVKNMSVKGVRN